MKPFDATSASPSGSQGITRYLLYCAIVEFYSMAEEADHNTGLKNCYRGFVYHRNDA